MFRSTTSRVPAAQPAARARPRRQARGGERLPWTVASVLGPVCTAGGHPAGTWSWPQPGLGCSDPAALLDRFSTLALLGGRSRSSGATAHDARHSRLELWATDGRRNSLCSTACRRSSAVSGWRTSSAWSTSPAAVRHQPMCFPGAGGTGRRSPWWSARLMLSGGPGNGLLEPVAQYARARLREGRGVAGGGRGPMPSHFRETWPRRWLLATRMAARCTPLARVDLEHSNLTAAIERSLAADDADDRGPAHLGTVDVLVATRPPDTRTSPRRERPGP